MKVITVSPSVDNRSEEKLRENHDDPPPTQSPNFNLWPEPKTKIPIRTHHIWRSFRRRRRGRGHSGDRDTQLTFSITGSFRDFMQPFKIKLSCSV